MRAEVRGSAWSGTHLKSTISLRFVLGCLLLFVIGWCQSAAAQPSDSQIKTAAEVRRLTADQAGRYFPVKLRGVVTFFDEGLFSRFLQDETAGVYFRGLTNTTDLEAGQVVELEGFAGPGEYAPMVEARRVRVIGKGAFPRPKPTSFEQLSTGQEDSQFVEVVGVVRSIQPDELSAC